ARTEELILRRLKLVDLCDQGKTDLAEGFLPLAHAELLARFPEKTQLKLFKDSVYKPDWRAKTPREGGTVTIAELHRSIENNNVSRSLKSAKFDTKDSSLHPEGLVCSAYPARTGYSPKLFTDTSLGKKDSCLDGDCWNSKLRAMLIHKREKLAGELPNPKKLPLKELVQLVPMVKGPESWKGEHRDVSIGKGIYLKNDYNKKQFIEVKAKECDHVEKALRVGGNGIGATTLICRTKSCAKHKVQEASRSSNGSYDYEADQLKRQERDLNRKIADAVRVPLITKKAGQFSEANWIFDNDKGRRFLLASILTHSPREIPSSLEAFPKIAPAELIKNQYQDKDFYKIVEKFDAATVSQVLALICFCLFGKSNFSSIGDQSTVRQLAEEFGDNYDLQAAEERVKLTPTEGGHRAKAQVHLDALKAGKKSTPPTVFWPRPKKVEAKKPAAKKKAKAAAK
ncbi:MAG TPA: hypothetical protein VHQ01_06790, partial [Pyrinomonadaceae bacterium]|nr:hypothetical protein [Pyrinomonadaceae bacterium]